MLEKMFVESNGKHPNMEDYRIPRWCTVEDAFYKFLDGATQYKYKFDVCEPTGVSICGSSYLIHFTHTSKLIKYENLHHLDTSIPFYTEIEAGWEDYLKGEEL